MIKTTLFIILCLAYAASANKIKEMQQVTPVKIWGNDCCLFNTPVGPYKCKGLKKAGSERVCQKINKKWACNQYLDKGQTRISKC